MVPLSTIALDRTDSLFKILNDMSIEQEEKNSRLFELKDEIKHLDTKVELLAQHNDRTTNGISTQLSAASYNLTLFAILFGVTSLILGIYITYVYRKIVKIGENNKFILEQSREIKKEVETINNLIQNDIYGLYLKIKREETEHILKRLVLVPYDIVNFVEQLVSRDLEPKDFSILKEAYLKIIDLPELSPEEKVGKLGFKDSYRLIFFQHFLDLSIKDKLIGSDLNNFYKIGIENSFENDIIKSSEDFINAIIDEGFQSKKEEIRSFFIGLLQTEYRKREEIYNTLFYKIKSRDKRFKFYDLIPIYNDMDLAKTIYGRLLIKEYQNSDRSNSENEIFIEIKSMIEKDN